jgi:hypothetical protein
MEFFGNLGKERYKNIHGIFGMYYFGNLGKEMYTNIHGIFWKFRERKV